MLFRHVPTQLVESLNQLNDAVATVADIAFDEVRDTTPTELALNSKNTRARIRGISAKYFGTSEIFYNRIRLDTAFANQLVKVTFLKPFTSLHSQLNAFNEEFSAVFTTDDLEDFVPADPLATTGTMTLTAKVASLGWKGAVEMAYEVIDPVIVAIPDTQLDGVLTPNDRIDVAQGTLLYTAYDFKVFSSWLEGLPVEALSTGDVTLMRQALMTLVPGIDWAETGPAPYSLEGISLVYVGDDPAYILNTLYKHVAVFRLGSASTAVAGLLYLHYSKEGDDV